MKEFQKITDNLMQHSASVWFAAANRFFVFWNFLNKSYTIRIIFVLCLAIPALNAQAQKEDLKKLCADYEKLVTTQKPFHLPYVLTVASSLDTTVERMPFDLYMWGEKDVMKMGEKQEVIHDGILLLTINHEIRTMRIRKDSANLNSKNILVSSFTPLIDSSTAVAFSSKDHLLTYTLTFPPQYVYSSLQLTFSKKSKNLMRIYAVYSEEYPSEFKYIEVDYKEPDFKWVPEPGFPGMSTYISQTNGQFRIQEAFDSYKIY